MAAYPVQEDASIENSKVKKAARTRWMITLFVMLYLVTFVAMVILAVLYVNEKDNNRSKNQVDVSATLTDGTADKVNGTESNGTTTTGPVTESNDTTTTGPVTESNDTTTTGPVTESNDTTTEKTNVVNNTDGDQSGNHTNSSCPDTGGNGLPDVCLTKACIESAARISANLDVDVDPCQDIYQFACGGWVNSRVLPDDKGTIFYYSELKDKVTLSIKALLEKEKREDFRYVTSAKDLYASCMDVDQIESKSERYLKKMLKHTSASTSWPLPVVANDSMIPLEKIANRIWEHGVMAIFSFMGQSHPTRGGNILTIDQPDLFLMARGYYLEPRNDPILKAYEKLVYDIARLQGAGQATGQRDAKDIVDFEIQLAKITVPEEDRKNRSALDNDMTLGELYDDSTEVFDWKLFIGGVIPVKLTRRDEPLLNRSPDFFKGLKTLLEKTPRRVLGNYLVLRVIKEFLPFMSSKYQRRFLAYSKAYGGVKEEGMRYEKCIKLTLDTMGLALENMYVKEYFNEEIEPEVTQMTTNIKQAFLDLLDDIDWMDDDTKEAAREKAKAISNLVGHFNYTDNALEYWYREKSYDADDLFRNLLEIRRDKYAGFFRDVVKAKTEDSSLYGASVMASYNPQVNQIMFSAGILQKPFIGLDYPKYLNYGALGSIIGHEITHGFDDSGRLLNKSGMLDDWWSPSAAAKFLDRAQCMIDQYGNFTDKQINAKLNGVLTLGENIADNGGLKQAFKAYTDWVDRQDKEELPLPGLDFTPKQLFFVRFAQLYCNIATDQYHKKVNLIDVHSLPRFRLIGSVQNSQEFSDVFKCKPGDPMSRVNKCHVW